MGLRHNLNAGLNSGMKQAIVGYKALARKKAKLHTAVTENMARWENISDRVKNYFQDKFLIRSLKIPKP
jgi:hypothetical protein